MRHQSDLQRWDGSIRLFLAVLFCIGLTGLSSEASALDVFLSEISTRTPESVELYNADLVNSADVSGFEIEGSDGTYVIPPGTTILPGSYRIIFPSTSIMNDLSGETGLIDPIAPEDPVDVVTYGQLGSAPAPHFFSPFSGTGGTVTLVRAPDPSDGTPPTPDPETDGLVWTLDLSPTPGEGNDAPQAQLGFSIILNEVSPFPEDGGDSVELFNTSSASVDLNNYFVATGQTFFPLPPVVILAGEFLSVQVPAGIELEETGLLYLFDNLAKRIDQIGFWDAPPLRPGECYGRCPDGQGPNLGFNWSSSGGEFDFFGLPCTLGGPNGQAGCSPTPVFNRTWGWIKMQHR